MGNDPPEVPIAGLLNMLLAFMVKLYDVQR